MYMIQSTLQGSPEVGDLPGSPRPFRWDEEVRFNGVPGELPGSGEYLNATLPDGTVVDLTGMEFTFTGLDDTTHARDLWVWRPLDPVGTLQIYKESTEESSEDQKIARKTDKLQSEVFDLAQSKDLSAPEVVDGYLVLTWLPEDRRTYGERIHDKERYLGYYVMRDSAGRLYQSNRPIRQLGILKDKAEGGYYSRHFALNTQSHPLAEGAEDISLERNRSLVLLRVPRTLDGEVAGESQVEGWLVSPEASGISNAHSTLVMGTNSEFDLPDVRLATEDEVTTLRKQTDKDRYAGSDYVAFSKAYPETDDVTDKKIRL